MLQTRIVIDAYPPENGTPEMLYPRRTLGIYKMPIALAIATREENKALDRSFTLCLPRKHLDELLTHFAGYKWYILRTCITDADMSHVLWMAPASPPAA